MPVRFNINASLDAEIRKCVIANICAAKVWDY
jgi:hypothetical protein